MLEERALLLSPQACPIEVYPIREIAGISGDGYTIQLRYGGDTSTLSRVGAGGPTLVEALRRAWLPLRADALRLAACGQPKRFAAQVLATPGSLPGADAPQETPTLAPLQAAQPFEALLYDDILLVAREGLDIEPLFLTDLSAVTFDDTTYTVQCRDWEGAVTIIFHLAGQTHEFMHELNARRGGLAQEAGHTLAALAPRATQAVTNSWIAQLPRRGQAATLVSWAEPDELYLGYTRPDAANGPELWLLAARGDRWLLENLSGGDLATYQFQGDSQTVGLTSHLLCAPQFSREALYLALDQLTGERADLATAARDLGFLKLLRERFRGQVVHSTPQAWEADVDG